MNRVALEGKGGEEQMEENEDRDEEWTFVIDCTLVYYLSIFMCCGTGSYL